MAWQVGDTAMINKGWTSIFGQGKVTAVGRIWVTVKEHGGSSKFRIADGRHSNPNDNTRIITVEAWERYKRDEATKERLRVAGIQVSTVGRSDRPLTDEQLNRIAAVAEGAVDDERERLRSLAATLANERHHSFAERSSIITEMLAIYDRAWNGVARTKRVPVDPEMFRNTAPRWNCVDYSDGPHYVGTPDGSCGWCGATTEQMAKERV